MDELVTYWKRAKLSGDTLVHPADEAYLRQLGRVHEPITSFDAYKDAFRRDMLVGNQVHLGLMPQPYLGNLAEAKVIILLLNPGLHANDFYLEHRHPDFRAELRATLHQTRKTHLFLDPKWAWTSGFMWWEKKLRGVAQRMAEHRPDKSYARALKVLSRAIASIELIPYHSVNSPGLPELPSSKLAREAVERISQDTNKTIIVTRAEKRWGLSCADDVIIYKGGEARGAHLGPKTRGGKAILKAFNVPIPNEN